MFWNRKSLAFYANTVHKFWNQFHCHVVVFVRKAFYLNLLAVFNSKFVAYSIKASASVLFHFILYQIVIIIIILLLLELLSIVYRGLFYKLSVLLQECIKLTRAFDLCKINSFFFNFYDIDQLFFDVEVTIHHFHQHQI